MNGNSYGEGSRDPERKANKGILTLRFSLAMILLLACSLSGCDSTPQAETWGQKASQIVWVAYSPPSGDPDKGVDATSNAVWKDLEVLKAAGFTGLVTYGSSGVLGRELPSIAEAQGFKGLILGIWDPSNQQEIEAATEAAKIPIVLGLCVGNEGLGERYDMETLSAAIETLRKATDKYVTTAEQLDDYFDKDLLQLGDWVFPNAHPYFHSQTDPNAAVRWTEGAYDDLDKQTDKFVLFKEVGLPTDGDPKGQLSEEKQADYYTELAKTTVKFVYFEGFDQPWKTSLPVEPHWGIFRSDGTPKLLGARLMGTEASYSPVPKSTSTPPGMTPSPPLQASALTPTSTALPTDTPESTATSVAIVTGVALATPTSLPQSPIPESAFYIYKDADFSDNHYKPTGLMGDVGDIQMIEIFEEDTHTGTTSIRVIYDAEGKGPNECSYAPPCKWAGVYWQEPPNNWGKDEALAGKGLDLSRYDRLLFWARADKPGKIEFKVGGINERYGDSLKYGRRIIAELSTDWREYKIDLSGEDLTHIIGGFAWVTDWNMNPEGITFYLDDVRFEEK